jgi:hypothetical protein
MLLARRISKSFHSEITENKYNELVDFDWNIVNFFANQKKISLYEVISPDDALDVAASMALGQRSFEGAYFIIFKKSELDGVGSLLKKTPGETPIISMNNRHWDLECPNLSVVIEVAKILVYCEHRFFKLEAVRGRAINLCSAGQCDINSLLNRQLQAYGGDKFHERKAGIVLSDLISGNVISFL